MTQLSYKETDALLFVTSFFPYANREAWVEDELVSIDSERLQVCVAPRSFGSDEFSSPSLDIINVPMFSIAIIFEFFRQFGFKKYFKLFCLSCSQSNTVKDFFKRVAVLPKALYIAKLLKDRHIKHVHIYTTTSAATMGSAIAVLLNVDWSFTLHTSTQLTECYRNTYTSLYRQAKFVRCISEKSKGDLIKFLGVDSSKMIVSRLGVIPTKIVRDQIVNSRQFFIVAALEKYKGVEYALHAFHQLRQMGLYTQCHIVGEGSQRLQLQKLSVNLGISKDTHFIGHLEHSKLINLLDKNRGSALVLTSNDSFGQEEGVPVVIMEAMNYGLFVITTRNGAIGEIVTDNLNGFLVDQRNISQVTKACERYLKMSNDVLEAYIRNSRLTIESDYDIQKNATKFTAAIM